MNRGENASGSGSSSRWNVPREYISGGLAVAAEIVKDIPIPGLRFSIEAILNIIDRSEVRPYTCPEYSPHISLAYSKYQRMRLDLRV